MYIKIKKAIKKLIKFYKDLNNDNILNEKSNSKNKKVFGPLPTYANYINIEELYDVDEIEDLHLQAAKKRGW